MSEDQVQTCGIELKLSNTKKNLMEALNQNAELQKRVEELESQLNIKQAYDHCVAHTPEYIEVILGENQTLKAQNDRLEAVNERQRLELISENDRLERNAKLERENEQLVAKIAELKSAVITATNKLVEIVLSADYRCDQTPLNCLQSTPKVLYQALSTPTGNALLAKIEAGEKMAKQVEYNLKQPYLSGFTRQCLTGVLSAYRAACVKTEEATIE